MLFCAIQLISHDYLVIICRPKAYEPLEILDKFKMTNQNNKIRIENSSQSNARFK